MFGVCLHFDGVMHPDDMKTRNGIPTTAVLAIDPDYFLRE